MQWRRQDLGPKGAHAKVSGFLQEATVEIQSLSDFVQVKVH